MRRSLWGVAAGIALLAGLSGTGLPTAEAGNETEELVAGTQAAAELASDLRPAPAITLLTGDRVQLGLDAKKRITVSGITAAPRDSGRPVAFHTVTTGGNVYVYPSDALALVAANRVDAELFNVSYLAENGYTDAETTQLPVIVQYGKSVAGKANALPASEATRTLESIDATAFDVTKSGAQDMWAAVTTPAKRTLDGGLTRIWLNSVVKADLDVSVPKIGAPIAWQAGYDGTGTTVAVLDTGIDDQHPDLAGHVLEARSFMSDGDLTDGHGHGTHVASTIAGSGAASDGRYKGVAPGAKLLAGKVLSDAGTGDLAGVIDGMEWAATSGADVVNLSLGAPARPGGDAASEAVDALTATYGTLFVIAAGNSGPDAVTIGTPGTATAALTVAAVDKSDRLASFSSRGPRVGDLGLKPDIAAPGVAITAARANSTGYQSMNGTSMATPHVAGAAAILAQQHPSWNGRQLKDALVGSAVELGYSPYEQGSGRVDVARAVRQTVLSDGPVDFGRLPFESPEPVRRTITYTNEGTAPVTLQLTPSFKTYGGQPAPAGLFTLAATSVVVPAGGTAQVAVSVDPRQGEVGGLYRGTVKATGADVALTTVVAAYAEPESHDLTVTAVAPEGATDVVVDGWLLARNEGAIDFTSPTVELPGVPTASVRLAAGSYTVAMSMSWRDAAGELNSALVIDPKVELAAPGTKTFDLRQASRVTVRTDRPSESYDAWFGFERGAPGGDWALEGLLRLPYGAQNYWTLPTGPVSEGTFGYASQHVLGEPLVRASTAGLDLHPLYRSPDSSVPKLSGTGDYRLVYDGTGAAARAEKTIVLLTPTDICAPVCGHELADRVERLADLGASAVLVAGSAGRVQLDADYAIPTMTLPPAEARALRDRLIGGPVSVRVQGAGDVPYLYLLRYAKVGEVPAALDHQVGDDELTPVEQLVHSSTPGGASIEWSMLSTGPVLDSVSTPTFTKPRVVRTLVGPVDTLAEHRFVAVDDEEWVPVEFGYHALTSTKPREIRWFAPPVVPGPPTLELPADGSDEILLCSVCRENNRFYEFMYLTTPEPAHQTGHVGLGREQFELTCADPERGGSRPGPPYTCETHLYDDTGQELTPYIFPENPVGLADALKEGNR